MAKRSRKEVEASKQSQQASEFARRTLDRNVDRTVLLPVKEAYEQATSRLNKQLRLAFKGKVKEPVGQFEATLARRVMSDHHDYLLERVAESMTPSAEKTLLEGAQTMQRNYSALSGQRSILDDRRSVSQLIDHEAVQVYQARIDAIRHTGAQLMNLIAHTINEQIENDAIVGEMLSDVENFIDRQWWRIRRLVETETSYLFNRAQAAALGLIVGDEPRLRLMKRWTERVRDFSLEPYDAHVGQDSIEMHSQLADVVGMFFMDDLDVSPQGSWFCPPNRPFDRAVLLPWVKAWGVPGYVWDGDKKVWL